ncbi:hypothetical protein [Demequina soli]|uniref:hypothetical protein n=1 Tax=Demequina soli TaxID=1638987 RepID=UPI000785098F|nr:hypothetical protein [Demequina soli]
MSTASISATPVPALSAEQLGEVLALLPGTDSVELKATVPGADRRRVVDRLGIDPLEAELRQVAFFDTADLALSSAGVVLRARRVQRRAGDAVVKLRPVDPSGLSDELRASPSFGVEIDAMPGGFVCSASMKGAAEDRRVREVLLRERPIRKLFTKEQRALVEEHAPAGVGWDDLRVLGPLTTLKLKLSPEDLGRRLVAELWAYPDGSQILELSTKCAPGDAFTAAAETKAFLASRGVDLGAPQQTKTRTAMEYFASLED